MYEGVKMARLLIFRLLIVYIATVPTTYAEYQQIVKEIPMNQANTKYWTIAYAMKLVKESANISYGIEKPDAIADLVAQKNKGDPNALFAYAYLLQYYNTAYESFHLSYDEAHKEAFDIFWKLSEQGHPQSCDEILNYRFIDIKTYKKITDQQLINKQLNCTEVAIKNNLENYNRYADILLFEENADNAYSFLITESKNQKNLDAMQQAANLYEKCAKETGITYCIARTAEFYYDGIGVEQDNIKAAAWVKLVTDRANKGVFKTIDYAYKINDKLSHNEQIQQSEEFQKLYLELQKIHKRF